MILKTTSGHFETRIDHSKCCGFFLLYEHLVQEFLHSKLLVMTTGCDREMCYSKNSNKLSPLVRKKHDYYESSNPFRVLLLQVICWIRLMPQKLRNLPKHWIILRLINHTQVIYFFSNSIFVDFSLIKLLNYISFINFYLVRYIYMYYQTGLNCVSSWLIMASLWRMNFEQCTS